MPKGLPKGLSKGLPPAATPTDIETISAAAKIIVFRAETDRENISQGKANGGCYTKVV